MKPIISVKKINVKMVGIKNGLDKKYKPFFSQRL